MAVIIDDQASQIYPLNIRSSVSLSGIDKPNKTSTADLNVSKVTIGGQSITLEDGKAVTIKTATEEVSIKKAGVKIVVTVSKMFESLSQQTPYPYRLKNTGEIKSVAVGDTTYSIGNWPHMITLAE